MSMDACVFTLYLMVTYVLCHVRMIAKNVYVAMFVNYVLQHNARSHVICLK